MVISRWVSENEKFIKRNGLILDLACGSGRHGKFLLEKGFNVVFLDRDISQIEILTSILDKQGINTKEVLKALDNGDASKALRDEVDESVAHGVFGSPTFRVGKELFFGLEKLEVVDDWLRLGGW